MKLKDSKTLKKEIEQYLDLLKLSTFKSELDEALTEAISTDLSYELFLLGLLEKKADRRIENGKKNRIRLANFPYHRYLEDIEVEELPQDAQEKLGILSTLKFIEDNRNVILAGNAGTGKTHITIGLGIKACMEGYKVLFTTVPVFINKLKECRSNRTLRAYQNKFEKYDLVILDELGYISSDKEGAELLFNNLSLRTGRKSTIVTTNMDFERWGEIFLDPVMPAAMTDRLTHKSYLVDMNGPSYRLKETKEWLNSIN